MLRSIAPMTRVLLILVALLVVQSAYLAADASPNLFYVGNVFAHFFGGLLLTLVLVRPGLRWLRAARALGGGAFGAACVSAVSMQLSVAAAVVLAAIQNTRANQPVLAAHIALAVLALGAACVTLLAAARRGREAGAASALRLLGGAAAVSALLVVLGMAAPSSDPRAKGRIENPLSPPATMDEEAMGGAQGPFFPSSAATSTGGRVPSNFFMTSETCARCHQDIYRQWTGSAHHFSSFNNQWYRKSIEYMQSVNSVESAKWCAGCHDHAVLFNGMMDEPVRTFIATQEAHTGLSCNSCHAITHVKGTMGQGGFHIQYPPMHDMAVSENPALRWAHDFAVRLDAAPHRETFLKPFHRDQTSEFCSSCHKVHLDVPVNNYRWFRGFNEYDNWQASGVSGQGARAFYYPPQSMGCADCHMPLVASRDQGNVDGFVHDHSFLAANTALPLANLHEEQLRRTIEFLQKNQVTVDIFAAGPARPLGEGAAGARPADMPRLSTTFAVGEEQAQPVGDAAAGRGTPRELVPITAPLDRLPFAARRGEDLRVDVVVRTRGVGHFFPGGTVDAHEVWLEVRATDETGRILFWSGVVEDGGRGPVDEGAQFYRSQMLDAHGNPITRRNAWATRAVAWVKLIPPGAADVAHYRLSIPEDCGRRITVEARLNYRKFTHVNTQFAFAEEPAPEEPGPESGAANVTPHYDDRRFVMGEVPEDVSAEVREIPDLPTVVVHRHTLTLEVSAPDAAPPDYALSAEAADWGRWNDYGIGLFLQDDLQGARRAFEQARLADPKNAGVLVNLGRVAVREGLLAEAEDVLGRALALEPELASAHYFTGLVLKEQGDYDKALAHLRRAAASYPRDRVVQNAIGRVLFLQRRYAEAVKALQEVLAIDPEDLAAHYNLMLCHRGLGNEEESERERKLYVRFKADEDATAILGPYLRENPEDNRMRQPIHEQVSAPAGVIEREAALRASRGEPNVVLPGQAAEYARRAVEEGRSQVAAGRGAKRHRGPTEAGTVSPVAIEEWRARVKAMHAEEAAAAARVARP